MFCVVLHSLSRLTSLDVSVLNPLAWLLRTWVASHSLLEWISEKISSASVGRGTCWSHWRGASGPSHLVRGHTTWSHVRVPHRSWLTLHAWLSHWSWLALRSWLSHRSWLSLHTWLSHWSWLVTHVRVDLTSWILVTSTLNNSSKKYTVG